MQESIAATNALSDPARRSPALRHKHLLEHRQRFRKRRSAECAESFHEALAIDRPKLVKYDVPILAAEPARDAEWVRVTTRGEWRHNERAHVGIEFVGRDDDARTRPSNLAASRGTELHAIDLAAANGRGHRHSHSSPSNRVAAGESISPVGPNFAAASAHPARTAEMAVMTTDPACARISTSSVSPASSRSGFASRTPREFPISAVTGHSARDGGARAPQISRLSSRPGRTYVPSRGKPSTRCASVKIRRSRSDKSAPVPSVRSNASRVATPIAESSLT